MENEQKQLVEHENITRLTIGDKNIALIGTAHVSQESADLVKQVIDTEKPDVVCVELCENRLKTIQDRNSWKNMDLVKVIKEKKAMILIINFLLSSFQRKIAKKFGVKPGQEMIQAIESANEHNLKIGVIDRDVRTTISRTWGLMSVKSKFRLFLDMGGLPVLISMLAIFAMMIAKLFVPEFSTKYFLLGIVAVFFIMSLFSPKEEEEELTKEKLEEMKKQDTLELLLAEMGKSVPDIKLRLIDERDLYMVEKLRHVEGKNIIAIVGAGHVPGMIKNWQTEVNLAALNEAPPKSHALNILKWAVPFLIVFSIGLGFYMGGMDKGMELVWVWILINGSFSALGTLVALGHPLSIISAFIAAPITTLSPFIGVGMVVGFVEAILRKPTVADFEALPEDFTTVKGWWKNKVTRILLVFFMSNLGGTIGVWVAGFEIFARSHFFN